MKILITGSSGFIGSRLLDSLEGNDVYTLDKSASDRDNHFNKDIREFDRFSDFDRIYHLAALSDPRRCNEEPDFSWSVNVEGTRNILSQMEKGQEIIFASSGHVYGTGKDVELSEEQELSPDNHYGLTKMICEELIHYYGANKGIDYNILRLFNVFGKGQDRGFLIPDVIYKAKNRSKIKVEGGETIISPVHVNDVVDIMKKPAKNEKFNVAGENMKIKDIYADIADFFDAEVIEECEAQSKPHLYGSSDKVRQAFDVNFRSWKSGLNEVMEEKN